MLFDILNVKLKTFRSRPTLKERVPHFSHLANSPFQSNSTNMAILGHLVTILVTDFTNPVNFFIFNTWELFSK